MATPEEINKRELMEYYNYKGRLGELRLYYRLLKCYANQCLASISPSYELAVKFHRKKGTKIGNHVYIGPNVHIDVIYPELITIDDHV